MKTKKKSGDEKSGRAVKRRRARRVWVHGRFGFNLPVTLEACGVHARRRAFEEGFGRTSSLTKKLLQAATKNWDQVSSAGMRLRPEFTQAVRDLCSGAYGQHEIYETHLARAKTMWLEQAADAYKNTTETQRGGYWSRLATRITQVCAQACAAVAAHPVINGDVKRVDEYIDRQKSVAASLLGSDDVTGDEFCLQSQARYERITRDLLKGHVLSNGLDARVRRLAFGFATESEARKLADTLGSAASSTMMPPAGSSETGVDLRACTSRDIARAIVGRVVNASTAERVLEEHKAASANVAELNKLCQAQEIQVILISRLEQIIMEWASAWHAACEKGSGAAPAPLWSGTWLNSTPETFLASAMRLVAGPYVYGKHRKAASTEENDDAKVQSALARAVPREYRKFLREGSAAASVPKKIREYFDKIGEFVSHLSGGLRTEFDAFVQETLMSLYPALAPFVAEADGGGRFELGRIVEDGFIIRTTAARLATQLQVNLKVHARKRFIALVRAAIASLQSPTGWPRVRKGGELADNMKTLLADKRRRRRLEAHVMHKVRWDSSKAYVEWCEKHRPKIDDKPKKKLVEDCAKIGIELNRVVSAVTTRVRSLPGASNYSAAQWTELVSVVSRGAFTKDTDQAADFDVISCLTAGIKPYVDGVRDALVGEYGRAPRRGAACLTDERAVRRLAIETALQDAWVSTFALSARDDDEIKRVLNANERRVLKRAARYFIHGELCCELNLVEKPVRFRNGTDDDIIESIQNKLVRFCTIVETNVVYDVTAAASNSVLKSLKDQDFADLIAKEVRGAMDRAALALANIDNLTSAATEARRKRVRELAAGRPSSASAEDALDDDQVANTVDVIRLSSRERATVLKEMARSVSRAFALIVERAGDEDEESADRGATDTDLNEGGATEEGASTTPATPVTPAPLVGASSAVEGAPGDRAVRYWLPPRVGGECSPVCKPGYKPRAQNICSIDVASMAYKFDEILQKRILFPKGGTATACTTSAHGQRLLRAMCDPRRNGLSKRPPTTSGSFHMGVASVSYLYEDEVDADIERARTRHRAPVLSTDANETDVVFVGIDPGKNQTITACVVSPTKTRSWASRFIAISARELHASNAPAQRAKVNAQRRDEAEKKAARAGTSSANAISLDKAAYAPNQEKVRAAVVKDQAYERAAKKFIDSIREHYLVSMDEKDTEKWPTLVVSCGDKGVAPGQRWGASPMRGAPSTSVLRILQKISQLYNGGRYEFEVVSEMYTSKLCPACDCSLANFFSDRMLFPSEGARFKSPNTRNGRVCANPKCSWVRKCVNRDHVGAVNMLRVLARVLADDIEHSRSDKPPERLRPNAEKYVYESNLLEDALRGAFNVQNAQLRPPKKVRADVDAEAESDADSDADSDDDVTNRIADVLANLTVAEQRSSSEDAVAGAQALHGIATATKDRRRGRAQFSGSSPEQNARIRQRVQDKTPATRRLQFTPTS